MKTITLDDIELAKQLFGHNNTNLARISAKTGTTISSRGNSISIQGDQADIVLAETILLQLYGLLKKNFKLTPADIQSAITTLRNNRDCSLSDIFLNTVFRTESGKPITPRNPAQKEYIDAIEKNDILFSIGPAGTGKTYLAMAMAVSAFTSGRVKRIVLTRPAVEAGEALGFLPGDMAEKITPYLKPLYDALYDMLGIRKAETLIAEGTIEIAPLAFMRGRTLNNSFIILDEAQNTSTEQMKMFLTRTGFGSKAVVTGDITQIDLPANKKSGLVQAKHLLYGIKGIQFIYFTKDDVVRHELVSRIIEAYEQDKAKE
ncbi:MAG: PhoH family protein [Thermodesulfobacteriota bacterium]